GREHGVEERAVVVVRRRPEAARDRPARTAVAGDAVAVRDAVAGGEERGALGDLGGVETLQALGRTDGLHPALDVVPVVPAVARCLEERLGGVDEVSGERLALLVREVAAGAGRDRAEAAGDPARVVLEVVDLVEDAGPVQDALLLRAAAVREGAVERGRLARPGGEDPGDVVGEAARVAAGAAVPRRVDLGRRGGVVVVAVAGPAAAAGKEEAAAAIVGRLGGDRREGLDGGVELLRVAEA